MNFIKREISLLLASSMVIGITACGQSADSGSEEVKNPNMTTLRILEDDTAKEAGYVDELIKAFNDAYIGRGIQAEVVTMDANSNLAENGPDILYMNNNELIKYAQDNQVMALDQNGFACSMYTPQEAWDAFTVTVDGQQITSAVPVNVQVPMLFYRKDLAPEGWDMNTNEIPDYFEDFSRLYRLSKQLVEESDGQKYGLVAPCNDFSLMAEFVLSYDGYIFGTDEAGQVNVEDIGLGSGNVASGLLGLRQFARYMSEECYDDSISQNKYEKVADGTYFCTIASPDDYLLFRDKLVVVYKSEGLSDDEALQMATDNLGMTPLPREIPGDGSMAGESLNVDTIVIGSIKGYGISAYTEHKEACIEFINFATSSEMIKRRVEVLGIFPTNIEVAAEFGGMYEMTLEDLKYGHIYFLPTVDAVDQIWEPMQTLMCDVAKDVFRDKNGEGIVYLDNSTMQGALDNTVQTISEAIQANSN